ncbi:MAG: MarC family protein [Syntrophales bacterium]|jgi:MarC family membrane protein|nr:MarC family protein [Syntrophales bacterium]NLN59566.1 NAAT family transporter [Deltaproteobacteria bacterium]
MSIFSAALLLFLVMDPFGNIPFFLSILKHIDYRRQQWIIIREMLIALAVLVCFLFVGRYILVLLDISAPALSIAGGVILFLIALKMIFSNSEEIFGKSPEGEPLIVPLAIPFVAGPSALATVLLLRAREPSRWPEWLAALVIAWFLATCVLYLSSQISRLLGDRVLIAIERLMGMLLTTIAVEMFIKGISQLSI